MIYIKTVFSEYQKNIIQINNISYLKLNHYLNNYSCTYIVYITFFCNFIIETNMFEKEKINNSFVLDVINKSFFLKKKFNYKYKYRIFSASFLH